MRPSEVRPEDWSLYYNDTYMWHDSDGPVYISCSRTGFYSRAITVPRSEMVVTDVRLVSPIWPESAALNISNRAVYIGRRSRRAAQRSATWGHYFMMWGHAPQTTQTMAKLISPPEYPAPQQAIKGLENGTSTSVALNRDIILYLTPNGELGVICKGIETGTLQRVNNGLQFSSLIPDSPIGRRTEYKLQKGGILCL